MSTDTATISEELQKKYKESIALPQTEFPMRGNGAVREPEFQANWYSKKVYEKGLAKAKSAGAESFILHDGPPYLSSERIHIGTALNKILKDIVIKCRTYKEAKMMEVIEFQNFHKDLLSIFILKKMNFEKDERLQWNLFMNQFLNYSILHGRAIEDYLPSWVQ